MIVLEPRRRREGRELLLVRLVQVGVVQSRGLRRPVRTWIRKHHLLVMAGSMKLSLHVQALVLESNCGENILVLLDRDRESVGDGLEEFPFHTGQYFGIKTNISGQGCDRVGVVIVELDGEGYRDNQTKAETDTLLRGSVQPPKELEGNHIYLWQALGALVGKVDGMEKFFDLCFDKVRGGAELGQVVSLDPTHQQPAQDSKKIIHVVSS